MRGKVFHIQTGGSGMPFPAMHIFRSIADLLMPRECIVCGRPLLVDERHLCIWCRSDLPLTFFWLQSRNTMADKFNLLIQRHLETALGTKDHGTPPDGLVPSLEGSDPGQATEPDSPAPLTPYAYATALFFYRSKTGYRKITQSLKYHGNLSAGRSFARLLAQRLKESPYLGPIDIVVPVPLHWTRRWSRGYNQAEVIARELVRCGIGGTMVPDLLKRNRRTRTQTKLSVGQKAYNVKGAFSINRKVAESLSDSSLHILLVDDVFTTGATLFSCWNALHEWDPKARISIVTLGFVG